MIINQFLLPCLKSFLAKKLFAYKHERGSLCAVYGDLKRLSLHEGANCIILDVRIKDRFSWEWKKIGVVWHACLSSLTMAIPASQDGLSVFPLCQPRPGHTVRPELDLLGCR